MKPFPALFPYPPWVHVCPRAPLCFRKKGLNLFLLATWPAPGKRQRLRIFQSKTFFLANRLGYTRLYTARTPTMTNPKQSKIPILLWVLLFLQCLTLGALVFLGIAYLRLWEDYMALASSLGETEVRVHDLEAKLADARASVQGTSWTLVGVLGTLSLAVVGIGFCVYWGCGPGERIPAPWRASYRK